MIGLILLLFLCNISIAQDADQIENCFTNAIGMEFVFIHSGSFLMGSSEDEGNPNEHPQHKITISKSFYMSKYPVTVGEFRQFVTETGYRTEGEKNGGSWVWTDKNEWGQKEDANWKNPYFEQSERNPIVCINWNDAQAFTEWLKKKDGKNYRLPTEAEFEYACRAATTTTYFFENDTLHFTDYGWAQTLTSQGFPTHPVGLKLANPWGLFDMVGNAWQWCGDWYDESYYSNSPSLDPKGPLNGDYKVNRGGMGDDINDWSSYKRDALPPNCDFSNQSFRLVLEITKNP